MSENELPYDSGWDATFEISFTFPYSSENEMFGYVDKLQESLKPFIDMFKDEWMWIPPFLTMRPMDKDFQIKIEMKMRKKSVYKKIFNSLSTQGKFKAHISHIGEFVIIHNPTNMKCILSYRNGIDFQFIGPNQTLTLDKMEYGIKEGEEIGIRWE